MPRPRYKNQALAEYPGLIARKLKTKYRYYLKAQDGKRIPLGDDLPKAIQRYNELLNVPISGLVTFVYAAEQYRKRVLAFKKRKTQRDQDRQLDTLKAAFPDALLDEIEPVHIARYRDKRSKKTAANREMALFSHLWNWCREQGYTSKSNPVQGVRKNPERPRERYVTDEEYQAVWNEADAILQDAMDLALLTGQRKGDVLNMRVSDIADGCLFVRQGKTNKPLRIEIEGELSEVIERIKSRPRKATGNWLIQTEDGQRVTNEMLRGRFDKARKDAGADWQFRDLRAKSASDSDGLQEAQERLGHEDSRITRRVYRRGEKVSPLKRK